MCEAGTNERSPRSDQSNMVWEPQSAICCSLRVGTLAGGIIRIAILLLFILSCSITMAFIGHPTEFIILMCLIGGAFVSLIFSCLLIHGIRTNNQCLILAFTVLQKLEAAVVTSFFIIWMVIFGISQHTGLFILVLCISIGASSGMLYFIFVVRAYHLEMKRLNAGEYIDIHREEEAEPTTET